MAAETPTVFTMPVSGAPLSEKRSEETLRPDLRAVITSEKPQPFQKHEPAPPPTPRACGILRHEAVSVIHNGSNSEIPRQVVINGIPLVGIMFLDLANSGDFPANAFNQTPVPTFAAILMALGATFALVTALTAFVDARRSWRAVQLLRKEHQELQAKTVLWKEKDANPTLASFLHLNRRDIGTEFFERFGMEVFMGGAAFIISIGTYMAIGGDDDTVYEASNLISGYIGNSPAAFYGLINTAWSAFVAYRARRQRLAARTLVGTVHARNALTRRARLIQIHSTFSGISCLVSGALGMVTPTFWQPYPALAVLGLLFMYTLYLFRTEISYVRPPLSLYAADLTTADLTHEIDELLSLRSQIMATKKGQDLQPRTYCRQALEDQLRKISLCGSFEKFCVELFSERRASVNADYSQQIISLMRERKSDKLTLTDVLRLADEVNLLRERQDEEAAEGSTYHSIGQICDRLLQKKSALREISMRSRFLLELLGSHLISFPDDRAVYEKTV